MNRHAIALLLALPLAAQSPMRTTRFAGLPILNGGGALAGGALATGDVDGDGDLDIFFGNDNSPNQLLLNDGRGRFTDATAGRFVNVSPNASHSVNLGDIDGDGDLDILVGNDDYLSNRVYLNNGLGSFTDVTATALPPNAEFTQNQVVADFDQDGDLDWFTIDSPGCHFYLNNGAGVFTDQSAIFLHNIPANIGERYQMASGADIDNDGDTDVLVPNFSGMPTLLVNMGGGHLWPATTPLPAVAAGGTQFHKFADIDGDGDLDLLLGSCSHVLQNQGNGTFVDVTATAFPAPHTPSLASFDVDDDGDVDLITAQVLWLNDGTGHFAAQPVATNIAINLLAYYAADFDGDGDLDAPPLMNFTRQVDATAPPVHGAGYTVSVHTRPGAPSFVIAMASLAERITPLPPLGTLRLNPAMLTILGMQTVTAGPMQLSLPLPNNPALVAVQLHFQALLLDPRNGLQLSNAIKDIVQ